MKQFNDYDFELAEEARLNKDAVSFEWFKIEAIKRMDYLKPLLEELKIKKLNLYDLCYELSSEVYQLEELIQKVI